MVQIHPQPGLDTPNMANFRPVPDLSFMSKVIEKAVSRQLNEYFSDQGLMPRHQSAYRKHYSTEMAMLRVMSDALTAADQRCVTLIGLLDLSAAFDCVDNALLLQRLQHTFGLSGTVLCWLTSFVTGRSQQVAYGGQLSPTQSVLFGVPQGSVLGLLRFVLYTADLSRVAANHGFTLPQYTDYCQVYTSTSVDDATATVDPFSRCLDDVEAWLSSSRLRLNPDKTPVL